MSGFQLFHRKKHTINDKQNHQGLTGGVVNNVLTIDVNGLPKDSGSSIIDLLKGLHLLGNWNAATNTPTLSNGGGGAGNEGAYYIVSVTGTTLIDGENDWQKGDWIVSTGAAWIKIDNTDIRNIILERTVPATGQDYVELGSFVEASGSHVLLVSVSSKSATYHSSDIYLIAVGYNDTAGAWKLVIPLNSSVSSLSQILANVDEDELKLRIAGTTSKPSTFDVVVHIIDIGTWTATWTPASGTGTQSPWPTTFLPCNLIQQQNGQVSIRGQLTCYQQLNMNNKKIGGLAAPTLGTDAATKDYCDTIIQGSSNSESSSSQTTPWATLKTINLTVTQKKYMVHISFEYGCTSKDKTVNVQAQIANAITLVDINSEERPDDWYKCCSTVYYWDNTGGTAGSKAFDLDGYTSGGSVKVRNFRAFLKEVV